MEPLSHSDSQDFVKENPESDHVHQQEKWRNERNFLRTCFVDWRWEMLTWVLGTLGVAVVTILLIRFNNRPVAEWHSNVQITALIAASAQLSQSAFLVPISYSIGQLKWNWFRNAQNVADIDRFDLASRGPDGSIRLLYRFGYKLHLASLGAICTILLLGFPTFIQQAVDVTYREIPRTGLGEAHIQRSFTYDWQYPNFFPKAGTDGIMFKRPSSAGADIYLTNSVNDGILQSYVDLSNVTGNCPTGRCTWQPYTTLAVCSSTEDVTTLYNKGELLKNIPEWVASTELTKDMVFHSQGRSYYGAYANEANNFTRILNNNPLSQELAQIFLSHASFCTDKDEKDRVYAYRASFRLCLQRLSSSHSTYTNTAGTEIKEDVSWSRGYLPDPKKPADTHLLAQYDGDDYYLSELFQTHIGGQIVKSLNMTVNLTSSENAVVQTNRYESILPPSFAAEILGPTMGWSCEDQSERSFQAFTRRMDSIAASVTNGFRMSSNGTVVEGTVWNTEPFIVVNFYWLIMPLVLYLGITVFFLSTMFRTRNSPLWKSSSIAVLNCQSAGNVPNTTLTEMKKDASDRKMWLSEDKGVWVLEDQK